MTDVEETNREIVRQFIAEIWNGEDLDAIEDLAADDLVVHHLGAGIDRSRSEFKEFHRTLLDAIPDLHHDIEDIVAEGEDVVVYVSLHGTPERQIGALAATGESFDAPGFQKYRVVDGVVAELWVLPNAMGMLQQLGIFPDSPGKVIRLLFGAVKGRILGG